MNIEVVANRIHEIRGHRVMLDYDIAEMFEIQTKVLNQAVKRNIERFPVDFMFQLTSEEWEIQRSQIVTISSILMSNAEMSNSNMRSQIVTASTNKRNITARPYAYTEHGVTMLSSVIKSEKAVKTSISIVRAFVAMKQYLLETNNISKQVQAVKNELAERIDEQDVQIIEIYQAIDKLIKKTEKPVKRNPIGFKTKTTKPKS